MIKLKELRGEKTQLEIAKALDLPRATYSNYENGTRQPDQETLIRIANYFNVTLDYLLSRETTSSSLAQQENLPNKNTIVAIARGGEKVRYELTEQEMQAMITFLDNTKNQK